MKDEEERLREHWIAEPWPANATQVILARRALFDTVGRFNPSLRLAEDADWFLRVGGGLDAWADRLLALGSHARATTTLLESAGPPASGSMR